MRIYTPVATTCPEDDAPGYAVIQLDGTLLMQVLRAQRLCLVNDLAQAALRGGPERWDGEDKMRLTGDMLHVSAIDFWFSCYPKWGGGTFTTGPIPIYAAEALPASGAAPYFEQHGDDFYLDGLTPERVQELANE